MARIDQLFRYLKEKKGSDLHLLATLPPRVRVHGKLKDVEAALERDNFMSPEEAKDWGLIDEIVESRAKAEDSAT